MKNIVFINSHPIQYFVPLYQQLNREEKDTINLKVLYLSDETVDGYLDKQFGKRIEWDIPLLDGYEYKFIANNSWKPSLYNGFFGLLNWGLIGELRRMPKSIVISHGWAYASNILSLWLAKVFGHTVCMRGENPYNHEHYKRGWAKVIRDVFLKLFVFSVVDKFLYIGQQNRQLYESFGIPDSKLIFVPYAVDNSRFRQEYQICLNNRDSLRRQIGVEGKRVILYAGKLIPKKRPMDLLRAYTQLCKDHSDLALIYVGDGVLRSEIERYCAEHTIAGVQVTGFINQTDMSRYYTVADTFVMCSGVGETWGLAVNEAMNFDLPVVVSDLTGCAEDLVEPGRTGVVFKAGDVEALAAAIRQCLNGSVNGRASVEHVAQYSYHAIIAALKQISV